MSRGALVVLLAASPALAAGISALIANLPAQDEATRVSVFRQLVAAGPNGIAEIASMLREPGRGGDSKARYALHGLAVHVSRPDAEAERKMYSQSLAALLGRNLPPAAKRFLISQLQLAGGPEAVRALGAAAFDPELCEYASRALVMIGGGQEYLRKALGGSARRGAAGRNLLAVIQALGELHDEESVPALLKLVKSGTAAEDQDLRLTALYALAEIGDARASDVLTKAASVQDTYERAKATDALLLLARRLTEEGQKRDAIKIYQKLWQGRTDPGEAHVRAAAMQGMAAAKVARAKPKKRPRTASRTPSRSTSRTTSRSAGPAIDPDVLASWDEKLKGRLRESVKAGKRVSFRLESMRMRVKVVGLEEAGTLKVNARGAELGIAWDRLKLAEKKNLAAALAGSDPGANAIAAFYCLAAGDKFAAGSHLRKAGDAGKEAEAAFK